MTLPILCALVVAGAEPHQFSELRSVMLAQRAIRDLHPARLDPRKTFVVAVEGAARAEPLIHFTKLEGAVLVSIASETMNFDLTSLNAAWKTCFALQDFARFIEHSVEKQETKTDTRAIEIAMLDSILRSLDDHHSRLLKPNEGREGIGLEDGACVQRIALAGQLGMKLVVRREFCR